MKMFRNCFEFIFSEVSILIQILIVLLLGFTYGVLATSDHFGFPKDQYVSVYHSADIYFFLSLALIIRFCIILADFIHYLFTVFDWRRNNP